MRQIFLFCLPVENHLRAGQALSYGLASAVTLAGEGQRSEQCDLVRVGIRVAGAESPRGMLWTDCV